MEQFAQFQMMAMALKPVSDSNSGIGGSTALIAGVVVIALVILLAWIVSGNGLGGRDGYLEGKYNQIAKDTKANTDALLVGVNALNNNVTDSAVKTAQIIVAGQNKAELNALVVKNELDAILAAVTAPVA